MSTNAKAAKIAASLTAALCLFAAVTAARAGESRLAPVQVQATLDVDCVTPRVPGQQEIGRAFQIENFAQAYELRNRVQHIVTRACQSGVDYVRFVLDAPARPDRLRYVAIKD